MKRILFPTDFSESANNALAYAANFAKETMSELVLYNANSLFEQVAVETAYEKLSVLAKEVRGYFSIDCTVIVEPIGVAVSSGIGEEASAYDLVIMGTNGADDLIQFFNGSNAYNIILKLNVPALIIPSTYTYTKITNTIYAFDYLKERRLPVEQLCLLLETVHNKRVTVLQVLDTAETPTVKEQLEQAQQELHDASTKLDLVFETIFSAHDFPASINQYMAKTDSTVLCVCTQKRPFIERLFHKSVIKHVTAIANYPVFVVHQ